MSPEARNQLLFIAVVVLLLFVMVIRPARKRAQHVSKLQAALSRGDEVMLTSGIFGTVLSIDEEAARVQVSVADSVVLTVHRGAIAEIVHDVPADASDASDAPEGSEGSEGSDAADTDTASPADTADSPDGAEVADTDATTSHDATKRGAN